jgi:hypothetical protein
VEAVEEGLMASLANILTTVHSGPELAAQLDMFTMELHRLAGLQVVEWRDKESKEAAKDALRDPREERDEVEESAAKEEGVKESVARAGVVEEEGGEEETENNADDEALADAAAAAATSLAVAAASATAKEVKQMHEALWHGRGAPDADSPTACEGAKGEVSRDAAEQALSDGGIAATPAASVTPATPGVAPSGKLTVGTSAEGKAAGKAEEEGSARSGKKQVLAEKQCSSPVSEFLWRLRSQCTGITSQCVESGDCTQGVAHCTQGTHCTHSGTASCMHDRLNAETGSEDGCGDVSGDISGDSSDDENGDGGAGHGGSERTGSLGICSPNVSCVPRTSSSGAGCVPLGGCSPVGSDDAEACGEAIEGEGSESEVTAEAGETADVCNMPPSSPPQAATPSPYSSFSTPNVDVNNVCGVHKHLASAKSNKSAEIDGLESSCNNSEDMPTDSDDEDDEGYVEVEHTSDAGAPVFSSPL